MALIAGGSGRILHPQTNRDRVTLLLAQAQPIRNQREAGRGGERCDAGNVVFKGRAAAGRVRKWRRFHDQRNLWLFVLEPADSAAGGFCSYQFGH